jgi:hypothetical protein
MVCGHLTPRPPQTLNPSTAATWLGLTTDLAYSRMRAVAPVTLLPTLELAHHRVYWWWPFDTSGRTEWWGGRCEGNNAIKKAWL